MKYQFPLTWFRGSFYLGIVFSVFAISAMIYEYFNNDEWNIQSLNGHLAYGLLFIYFSGKPMVDERIRYLKFKGLTTGFVISFILVNIFNYLYTYPDGNQQNAISSYLFALICLIISFVCFYVLKLKDEKPD
ncbi:hypothetical protein [Chondrinema litorale]|uniref:hypothetical protein n=1 Tax=Chondrinema litorale TaxID=2994555 RepID=UPI002542AC4B|nr:hypothetical protein [Chondrinema litorale]UZR95260.1 hypothetical protein OQ292_05435 [Chondrinema litorale]